ncbi:Uncharacterized protein GBIM_11459 [Gryllus bimaculatus]|nr:Uncharacterized protein GBIM_11459 [Gryllus bimaculatus]
MCFGREGRRFTDGSDVYVAGGKYEPVLLDNAYKVHMKLTIKSVGAHDFGSYKCVSKNSLGETDGSIKLYDIPAPSTPHRPPITTTELSLATAGAADLKLQGGPNSKSRNSVASIITTSLCIYYALLGSVIMCWL